MTCFKYLGVIFQASRKKTAHINYSSSTAQKSTTAILRFHRTTGGNFIPATIKLFVAKPTAQILYGAPLVSLSNLDPYEKIQSGFLRSLLQTPKCVPNAALRLEAGLYSIKAKVWIRTLCTWLRLNNSPAGLLSLMLLDKFQSSWLKGTLRKLATYGLSPEYLLSLERGRAKNIIKERLRDIEAQNDFNQLPITYKLLYNPQRPHLANYLKVLDNAKHRWAFSRARFNALPSALLEGRYNKIPIEQRLCPCNSNEIETIGHVILYCPLYRDSRKELIEPILRKIPRSTDDTYIRHLLADKEPEINRSVAKYCYIATRIRRAMMSTTEFKL